jgi:hypothetical protein
MNRARQVTLIALAALVVMFVATWLTIPNKARRVGTLEVGYPARAFAVGLMLERCAVPPVGSSCATRDEVIRRTDIPALERRVKVLFGGPCPVAIVLP